ncbi:ABC transporter substrate-binding protein [Williamsia deligens]|uniref:ABC transporter substrate-binding protein n=1 Tax=Williamsia deligens TaxID=321325 RepID=A0ABW3GBY5_9NOCA|nr:ABC transporter substrate-binding protein [Williamsia deligens]
MTTTPLTTGFDRRSFLRGSAVAAMAIFGTAVAAGCSSAVDEASSAGDASATPKRGGTLKAGIPLDVVPANFLTNTAGATTVIGLAYDSLVRYPNDKLEPQPLLAKSWQLSSDGLSLTLELRDDVTFHSGRAFTSKDAEFSLRTYADPKWTAQLRSTAAAITSYDTSDPHRLVLRFAHPLGNIYDLLDTVPVLDSESLDKLAAGEAFIGTGPFKLTSRTPNSSLTFERNEKYFLADRPYLDRVEVSIVKDSQALLNSLRSGQVQSAFNLNYRDAQNLSKDNGFRTITFDGAELQIYVGANVTNPALADVRLRQAIAYALDRERVISEVFRGYGYTINAPWPKASPAFEAGRNETYALNTERAKQLVSAVGGVRAPLPLTYQANNPYYAATAQIVQANLAAVGIPVTLDPVEPAVFVKQLIGAQFPGLWVTFHSWAQYTPSTLATSAYPFNATKNASRFTSAAYTSAADSAWKIVDGTGAEAVSRYKAITDELLKDLFLIEIGVTFNQLVTSASVHGVRWTKRSEQVYTDAFIS